MSDLKSDLNNFQSYSLVEEEIDEMLRDEDSYQLRLALNRVEKEYLNSETDFKHNFSDRFFKKGYIYAFAAGIAILVGIIGVTRLMIKSSDSNCDALFSQYYQPYQSDFASRSDEVVVNNLYLAFQAYETKDYDKAVELFSKVISVDESVQMAYFYRGVSSIETGDYKLAIESLSKLCKNESNPYYSQAQWYTALTWLKLNNAELAKPHLIWLASNDRYYGNKAKEILEKLKK